MWKSAKESRRALPKLWTTAFNQPYLKRVCCVASTGILGKRKKRKSRTFVKGALLGQREAEICKCLLMTLEKQEGSLGLLSCKMGVTIPSLLHLVCYKDQGRSWARKQFVKAITLYKHKCKDKALRKILLVSEEVPGTMLLNDTDV